MKRRTLVSAVNWKSRQMTHNYAGGFRMEIKTDIIKSITFMNDL